MIRRRLLQSGLMAVLLCSFAAKANAKGDDAPVAAQAPEAQWSVGPISARSDDGTQFCSMKNNYPNGQSLVFARDTKGSNSIALDLHKDMFEAGHHYNVKLSTGGLSRRVQALAATTQVLALQLGVDSIFYRTLARKHNVAFTVQDVRHDYELDVSAADGLNALGRCTESLLPGSNVTFTASTFPLGKVSAIALQDQKAEEPFIDEAAAEAAIAPPPARKHRKAAKAGKAVLKSEIAEMQDLNRDLLLKNEKLREELAEQSVAVAPAPAPAPEPPTPAQTARDEMKAEIASEILSIKETDHAAAAHPSVPLVTTPIVMKPVTVDNSDLKKLIKDSQVVSGGNLTADKSNTLHWASNDLYGSAQQLPLLPGKSLKETADSYIKKSASLCNGEFAQKLGTVKRAGKVDVLEAEITCLDGKNNAAAAVLFVGDQGKVSVITQEGTIDQLNDAMSDRDAILSTASGTASD